MHTVVARYLMVLSMNRPEERTLKCVVPGDHAARMRLVIYYYYLP